MDMSSGAIVWWKSQSMLSANLCYSWMVYLVAMQCGVNLYGFSISTQEDQLKFGLTWVTFC